MTRYHGIHAGIQRTWPEQFFVSMLMIYYQQNHEKVLRVLKILESGKQWKIWNPEKTREPLIIVKGFIGGDKQ